MSKESERVIDLVDRARRHELPIEDLLTFNAAMNNAAEPLAHQVEHLETTNRALIEALEEAESVMEKNIYPKPDAPDDHPWRVLERARATLKQAKGESE